MAMRYNSQIVNDGLVFCVDAGNPKSYGGSGTSWRDLSGNGITCTSSGGPVFSTEGKGSFLFDAADDIFIAPENSAFNTQTPSVEVWIKTNNTNQGGFWFEKGTVNTQYSLFQEGTVIQWRQNVGTLTNLSTTTATYISTANWAHIVGTYTSGTRRLFINGALVNSDSQTGTIATNTNGISIGVFGGFNGGRGYYYNGRIGSVRVYNRALSPSDVLQNYNATKTRFGMS